jgi:hypothetical protein
VQFAGRDERHPGWDAAASGRKEGHREPDGKAASAASVNHYWPHFTSAGDVLCLLLNRLLRIIARPISVGANHPPAIVISSRLELLLFIHISHGANSLQNNPAAG